MRVLHISPHPDDELLGAPATLLALAEAGHAVVNLAVSLGRTGDHARREAELRAACARIGFTLRLCSPPHHIGRDEVGAATQALIADAVIRAGIEERADLLVAPSPHDGHHGHEVVGRAAVTASAALRLPLWLWGLWTQLPVATLLHPFDESVLARVLEALAAHAGELARNDYRELLAARGRMTAVVGPERVFGFGAQGITAPYAEELCEVAPAGGSLLLGTARVLDPDVPLAPPGTVDASAWLHARSPRDRLRRP